MSTSIVIKSGSGAGNYSLVGTAGSPFGSVDSVNLDNTVVVPIGSKLTVTATFHPILPPGGASIFFALFDGLTVLSSTKLASNLPVGLSTLQSVITGDGASHTVSFQYAAQNTFTAGVVNSLQSNPSTTPPITEIPVIVYRLEVSD